MKDATSEAEQRRIHNRLVKQGLIRPAWKKLKMRFKPLKLKGRPLSEILRELRKEK